MQPVFSHRIPDAAMRNPTAQGLAWALASTVASAALIWGAGKADLPYFTNHPNAMKWGAVGIGTIGYLLGADLARAENRTTNIRRTYERLEANGLLVPGTLPAYNDRQRTHQSPWGEALKAAAIQGVGSAALAAGVEAALTPAARPVHVPALEWGPVGIVQGAISGVLQARAHNRRADVINGYEAKAEQNAGFAEREAARSVSDAAITR